MGNIHQPASNTPHPMVTRSRFHWALSVPKFFLIFTVGLYRWTVSPALLFLFGPAGGCRFTPSCSQYAMDAVRSRGALVGGWLAVKRICRCHPWGGCGHDPAPKPELQTPNSKFSSWTRPASL